MKIGRVWGGVLVVLASLVYGGRVRVRIDAEKGFDFDGLASCVGLVMPGRVAMTAKCSKSTETEILADLEYSLRPVSVSLYVNGSEWVYLGTDGNPSFEDSVETGFSSVLALSSSKPNVVALYELWHTPAVLAADNVSASGGDVLAVEDVVRGNGTYGLGDVWDKYPGVAELAFNFYWQDFPAAGRYCLYKERSGSDLNYTCANIEETLARHAKELLGAGVDAIVTDSTNLDFPSLQADMIQVNPTRTIWEGWAQLRSQNVSTPSLMAWQRCDANSTLYLEQLALYNEFPDLAFVNPTTGKKVFFTPMNPDPTIVAAIEGNGGKNDIEVVTMWALRAESDYKNGIWPFFERCISGTDLTTSVVGRGLSPCGQVLGEKSSLGTVFSVSPSYQVAYSSLPYQAAGKFGGMTLKRQFATTFLQPTDNLFVSSYNELLAQPQPPQSAEYVQSWGLPFDPERKRLFVDTYGSSISRDLEATGAMGSLFYDTLVSCMRVHSLIQLKNGPKPTSSTPCPVATERCCIWEEELQAWHNVWSLQLPTNSDRLITADANERQILLQQGWVEICSPYAGPTDWCVDSSITSSPEALQGPFIAHDAPTNATGFNTLYRCYDNTYHFFSLDPNCEGIGSHENVLGALAPTRSTDTPRHLIRCRIPAKNYYHTLDGQCNPGDESTEILGFVH